MRQNGLPVPERLKYGHFRGTQRKILLFDGGTGSLLQEAGLKPGELPETWNISHPDIVVKLHSDYLEAGCDIIKTNTFGANRFKYNSGTQYSLKEIVTAAMDNAKCAVKKAGRGYIALDIGPTGKLLKPMGQLDFEEAVSVFRRWQKQERNRVPT